MTTPRIDWKKFGEFERSNTAQICRHFFPLGKQVAQEWKLGNVNGDPGDSLAVQLAGEKAGLWIDRATSESGRLRKLITINRNISLEAAAEEVERAFGLTFHENGSQNGSTSNQFDWNACVMAMAAERKVLQELETWRGLSDEFCPWLVARKLLGLYKGCIAFPIQDQAGKVSSPHYLMDREKKLWRYFKGTKVSALVIGDIKAAVEIHIHESTWDGLAFCDRVEAYKAPNVCAIVTRGAGHAKTIRELIPQGKRIYVWPQNDQPDPKTGKIPSEEWFNAVAKNVAGSFYRVQTPPEHEDLNAWILGGASKADLLEAIDEAKIHEEEKSEREADSRPIIVHPDDGIYISQFARRLGGILKSCGFYRFHGVAMQVREVTVKSYTGKEYKVKKLVDLPVPLFSTLIETYCQPMADHPKKGLVERTISMGLAKMTLVCLDFLDQLPEIRSWTDVRLPVRNGNQITLTRSGYDSESGIYTSPDAPEVDETVTLEEAAQDWRTLLKEFCFPKSGLSEQEEPDPRKREPERERCIAVALAAALTPLCLNLLPEKAKRPGFAASANAEGAGKTLLLSFGMVAKLGFVPTGSAPDNEEEIRKVLDSAVHYGVPILFFDNLKGHLSSGELEAFITGSTRRYRLLGTTNYTEADNLSTVYITANFATYSPDLRRRLLAVELFLEESRAEERTIEHFLDEDALIKKRPRLLSMFWAFIKHWHNNEAKPIPRPLPSFEQWSNVVGGIVENAGFSSPCQLATLRTGGDTDTQDMEKLVTAMPCNSEFKFSDLIDLARDHHLFLRLIPADCDMEKRQSTRMGFIIRKFVGRIFGGQFRFCLQDGTRKTERYYVKDLKNA